jgi:signal transduction histidine kinase
VPKIGQLSNRWAVTKDIIWQQNRGISVASAGALVFACLLAAITVWFSFGASGPWLALLGLGLALVAVALAKKRQQDLLVPLFLGLAAIGLVLFSGGMGGSAASAILWPILGAATLGGRWQHAIVASLCALVGLSLATALFALPSQPGTNEQSGILALGVCGALTLAACLVFRARKNSEHGGTQQDVLEATKERDAALAQAQEARAQVQGRSQFMAEMSHEIRTPLNAILGFADTMREGVFGPLPKAYGDYPELIHTSGTHLLDLVSDLLDLSKIEAGRYDITLKPLRLDEIVYEGVRLSSGAARMAGVQIRHEASPGVEVLGDARAVRQIVFNLLSNAIKFTPSGGRVTLRVLGSQDNHMASLEVEDNGVGISETDLAKIGQPWNQSQQNETGDAKSSRGSGLGLALVKRLTDLQNGSFTISSLLGVGTKTRISLPLATPPTSQ